MRLGVDVGVHAQRDRRALAHARRDALDRVELARRLDVEGEDARLERVLDLVLALADAARTRSSSDRRRPCSARKSSPRETMSTPAPSATSARSTAEVRVRLHRVADDVLVPGERVVEHLVVRARASRGCRRRPACRPRRRSSPAGRLRSTARRPGIRRGASRLLRPARAPRVSIACQHPRRAPARRRRRADRPRAPASSTANSLSSHERRARPRAARRATARQLDAALARHAHERARPTSCAWRNGTPARRQVIGELGRQQVPLRRSRARMRSTSNTRARDQSRHACACTASAVSTASYSGSCVSCRSLL